MFFSFQNWFYFHCKRSNPPLPKIACCLLVFLSWLWSQIYWRDNRQLHVRVDEHLSDIKSVIYQHISQNKHCQNMSHTSAFEIIDKAQTEFQLKIKESIQIRLNKPSLNKQIKHENLNIIF